MTAPATPKTLRCPQCGANASKVMIRGTRVPWEQLTAAETRAAGHCLACKHIAHATAFIIDDVPPAPPRVPYDFTTIHEIADHWFMENGTPNARYKALAIMPDVLYLRARTVPWSTLAAQWKHSPTFNGEFQPCTREATPTAP